MYNAPQQTHIGGKDYFNAIAPPKTRKKREVLEYIFILEKRYYLDGKII